VRKKGEGEESWAKCWKKEKENFPFMGYNLMNLKRDSKGIVKRSFGDESEGGYFEQRISQEFRDVSDGIER
jgi:hypothetical protein